MLNSSDMMQDNEKKLYCEENLYFEMKKLSILSVFGCLLCFGGQQLQAQQQEQKETPSKKVVIEEEEEGPTMFKFEPDFLVTAEQRKARISHARKILDTMNISDRRRRKLLKDLYKNGISERLSKTLYADTKYEDIED